MADVAGMRRAYREKVDVFDIKDLKSKNPFMQFKVWFEEACQTPGIGEANAMSLSTATKDGKPTVRMVLMKGYDSNGFRFYTNHSSRKAQQLKENPQCSIMFFWHPLNRYVTIEGLVERLSEEVSKEYFHSRPRDSQLGSSCSHQSAVVESRQSLDKVYEDLKGTYKDEAQEIPKPDFWGGYLIKPLTFEFWQGQTNRIHDRLRFRQLQDGEEPKFGTRGEDGWIIERLSP